jgi:hypothetical protein
MPRNPSFLAHKTKSDSSRSLPRSLPGLGMMKPRTFFHALSSPHHNKRVRCSGALFFAGMKASTDERHLRRFGQHRFHNFNLWVQETDSQAGHLW